ncbi:MAG: glycosyltransferase family 2 protein [Candidatus Gastranaerophilales bacterium]|nr:glycosyltransferase family 2 protein [Candidatus Gastranaerophilales bacterium]
MKAEKISIIIPIYNEINTLKKILEKIENTDYCSLKKEIILVDDFSNDGTRNLIKELESSNKYKIYYHTKNMGKGAAIRTALSYSTGDIIIIQDADLEYDPKDYIELIKLILEDKADVVYGSRLSGGRPSRSFKFWHLLGNKFLTLVTNILYDTTLSDMETCYKAFRADVIKNIQIKSNRFDFEPEITAKILKQKYHLYEVPISYYGRDYSEGKKITWKDGFSALKALLKYRFID